MGQTRLEQQLLTAFRAELVVVRAVASAPNDSIPTTAPRAIMANRRSFALRVIWIWLPEYPISCTTISYAGNPSGTIAEIIAPNRALTVLVCALKPQVGITLTRYRLLA